MSEAFRIGIVGAGGIAGAHVSAAKESAGALRVVGLADPNTSAAADRAAGCGAQAFGSARAMLDSVEVDGLVICTPPSARLEIVREALSRRIAVLVEKPLAHSAADASALAALAREHRSVLTGVAYCHRFTPAVLEMKRRAAAGELGTVTRFENCFATYFPALAERWMSDPAVSGGGSFVDTGSHGLDLFQFLVGVPETVALLRHHEWAGRGESSATAVVRSGGVAGVVLSGWLEPDRFTVALVGTKGLLHYDYLDGQVLTWYSTSGKKERLPVETHEVRFRRQLEAFAAAARGGDRQDLATFDDGLAIARAASGVGG